MLIWLLLVGLAIRLLRALLHKRLLLKCLLILYGIRRLHRLSRLSTLGLETRQGRSAIGAETLTIGHLRPACTAKHRYLLKSDYMQQICLPFHNTTFFVIECVSTAESFCN